jgi:spore maturation protein CgeB
MIKKIFFLVNWNLYESKRYFTEKLSEALNRKGIETTIFDIQENPLEAFDAMSILQYQPDLICSFNSIPPLPGKNKFFYDFLKIPCLSLTVDPAMYSLNLIHSPYSIVSCVDRNDCESFKAAGFEKVFFLPHATDKSIISTSKERIYDVVFIGSCNDYEGIREHWKKYYAKEAIAVLDDAVDQVLSDKYITITQALINALNAARISKEEVNFHELYYFLDFYTRGKDRVELIRSITDANVHVFGQTMIGHPVHTLGWSHYLGNQSNVTLHQFLPYNMSFDILKQSKICLNSMPFFKDGSHERIFNSLACGALPITSGSKYIEEVFEIGKDLFKYEPGHWKDVNAKVNFYLANDKERIKIVESGRKKVMENHTWDNRAEQLLEAANPIVLDMLCNGA